MGIHMSFADNLWVQVDSLSCSKWKITATGRHGTLRFTWVPVDSYVYCIANLLLMNCWQMIYRAVLSWIHVAGHHSPVAMVLLLGSVFTNHLGQWIICLWTRIFPVSLGPACVVQLNSPYVRLFVLNFRLVDCSMITVTCRSCIWAGQVELTVT